MMSVKEKVEIQNSPYSHVALELTRAAESIPVFMLTQDSDMIALTPQAAVTLAAALNALVLAHADALLRDLDK